MDSTARLELLSRTEIWDKCFQRGITTPGSRSYIQWAGFRPQTPWPGANLLSEHTRFVCWFERHCFTKSWKNYCGNVCASRRRCLSPPLFSAQTFFTCDIYIWVIIFRILVVRSRAISGHTFLNFRFYVIDSMVRSDVLQFDTNRYNAMRWNVMWCYATW